MLKDRKPYTYMIKHIKSGKVYYGCRFAKGCCPDDLWVTYFTSSKYIKKMIDEDGVDAFSFEIRKTFEDIDSCRKWEEKVLRRMNVIHRDDFINKNNVSAIQAMPGESNPMYGKTRVDSRERMKNNNPMKNPDVVKKVFDTRKKMIIDGEYKEYSYSEEGRKIISDKMKANNPMKDANTINKMSTSRKANNGGIDPVKGTTWIANKKTKERLRVKADLLSSYLSDPDWIRLSNRKPIPD